MCCGKQNFTINLRKIIRKEVFAAKSTIGDELAYWHWKCKGVRSLSDFHFKVLLNAYNIRFHRWYQDRQDPPILTFQFCGISLFNFSLTRIRWYTQFPLLKGRYDFWSWTRSISSLKSKEQVGSSGQDLNPELSNARLFCTQIIAS